METAYKSNITFEVTKIKNGWTLIVDGEGDTLSFFKGSREMTDFIRKTIDPNVPKREKKAVKLSEGTQQSLTQ